MNWKGGITKEKDYRKRYEVAYRLKNYERDKEKDRIYHKEYNRKNRAKRNEYIRNKRRTDIKYRIGDYLRTRLALAVKTGQKVGSPVTNLGCTIQEFKFYLEGKFKEGMTWKNHSFDGWHIDHIIPLNNFDLTDQEQLKKACHYTNLQPLWAKDNLRKNKYHVIHE